MANHFKKIVLMARRATEVGDMLQVIAAYLSKKGVDIALESEAAEMFDIVEMPRIDRGKLAGNCDLIIVIGGDGSLLNAAHIAVQLDIPILGVNRGTLGFLTDIHPDEIESIGEIIQGKYIEEKRFLLSSVVGASDSEQLALNDVVLLPSEINHMIEFAVYIDNQFVCIHRADGLIVATPTGSTAHALSGGGPILHPSLDTMVLLPMFPHTLTSRPIVISGESKIKIITSKEGDAGQNISCDGEKLFPIPIGGEVNIKKYARKLRLIHLPNYNYYETLRGKLHWEKHLKQKYVNPITD